MKRASLPLFSSPPRRLLLAIVLPLALLSACMQSPPEMGRQMILQGDPEGGLKLLQDQLRANPDDIKLRATFERQRQFYVQNLIKQGDAARATGDTATALASFQHVLQWDSGNLRAKEVVSNIEMDLRHASMLKYAGTIKTEHPEDAMVTVDQILQDNPRNLQARRLKDEIQTRLNRTNLKPQLAAALRTPISLQFRDQSLTSVFDIISRIGKVNFIFDRDVSPQLKTTIFARDTTVEDVINLLLATNQLDKKILNENTILIYPKRPDKDRDYKDLVMRTFYVGNADPKQVLAMLKQMVKTRDVYIDDRLNMIVMRDTPEAIDVAERLIAAIDLPQSEVDISAQILEVTTSDLLNLGIQYPKSISATVGTNGTDTTTTTTNTAYSGALSLADLAAFNRSNVLVNFGSPTITANLTHDKGDTNVLASPNIRVKNKEKAKILIGDRLPVITNTTSNGVTSENVNYQDVGLTLNVEPTISIDGDISMKVTLEVSNIVDTITTQTGLRVYQVGTRHAETVMASRDSETQVLGGLLSRNDQVSGSAIPGLGEVPVLDRIFGSKSTSKGKTELVLLITPHVVRNLPLPSSYITQFDSGTEGSISTEPLRLRSKSTVNIDSSGSGAGNPGIQQNPAIVQQPIQPAPQPQVPQPQPQQQGGNPPPAQPTPPPAPAQETQLPKSGTMGRH
ncbi:secretin N-terminal domain-containing protein [Amantichitinum ursilacus]|uniref:Type II secretion system protein D n=1 Tax=Amantichitinum ursilacus TaxID=857265 RepID=A0A0N0XLU0_9NEIS|nr:secretin N-terminal domain-containing protein [Amantichitinum ursilacus]KPC54446.1 Type II secretion system protein D precursor [Amantichitinum ursilacus]